MSTVSIYWLLDMTSPADPLGRPFYVGKANDPHDRFHKLLTDAWRGKSKRDRYIDRVKPENVRLHIVATFPAGVDWEDKLMRSIAIVRHCWPEGNCNLTDGAGDPNKTIEQRVPTRNARLNSIAFANRKRRRFRYHRRDKRPVPGDASAPRGSFRTDGSASWR